MLMNMYEDDAFEDKDDNQEDGGVDVNSHGTRTCIKRKKIDYGKFFDFCAEKCVYN